MGFAGRFLRPAQALIAEGKLAGNAAKKATLAAWGKELAMQAGGGAGGEFLAQKATGENKPSEVLMEGLAELMTAPLEARSNLRESKQLEAAARLKPAESVAERTEPTLEGGVESKAPPQTPTPSTVQQDEAQEVAAIAKELIAQNIPADNAWNIARKRVAQARKERITDIIAQPSNDPVIVRAKEYIDAGVDPVEAINRARVDISQQEDLGVQDVPQEEAGQPAEAVSTRPVEPAGGAGVPVAERPAAEPAAAGVGRTEPSGVVSTDQDVGEIGRAHV